MDEYNQADELENKTDSSSDPNKTLSPEDIAKLFASQPEPETAIEADEEAAETVEMVEIPEPEPAVEVELDPNKPLSPEDIAKLFASQTEPEAAAEADEEAAGTAEALDTSVPESVAEAEVEIDPNTPLSPDDIAKLFASQTEPEAAIEPAEEAAESAEVLDTSEPEPAVEAEVDPNKPLSPDDIAKLFASQTESETAIEPAEDVAETVKMAEPAVPEPAVEAEADPNKPLSPEDIAKLIASQTEPEAAIEADEEVSETVEVLDTSVPEPVAEAEADPNKPLSPDDIAKLFASQTEPEAGIEPAEEVAETVEMAETTVPEPAVEAEIDPNKPLSPDDIAKLFASQTEPEVAAETVEEVAETAKVLDTSLPEPVAEAEIDPNKPLSPDDIAKLIASQTEPETAIEAVEEAAETVEMVETTVPEPAVEAEADPNKPLSPDDIAKLFASQTEPEAAIEADEDVAESVEMVETAAPEPAVEAKFDPNKPLSPEDIAKLFASQTEPEAAIEAVEDVAETAEVLDTSVPEPVAEAEVDPNKPLSPEDIAKLFASQTEPEVAAETVEEVAESVEMVETVEPEPANEAVPEPETAIIQESAVEEPAISQPEIQETLAAEQVDLSQPDESPSPTNPFEDAVPGAAIAADAVPDQAVKKNKLNIISLLVGKLKSIFPKKKAPPVADDTADADAGKADKKEKTNFIDAIKKSLSKKQPSSSDAGKKTKKAKAARSKENASDNPAESEATKESAKSEKPRRKSGLKTALATVVVLLLMTGSFAAGFLVRDYNVLPGHDPAKAKAEVEAKAAAKAKKAADEKRAAELAKVSPKDYTSSMYLDSLILKGKAEILKTIKLKKIDDVSKLAEFPNLRKIKFDGMTGDEDLSVIQKLSGLEEISIENSVIRNQFKNGSFGTVTYVEIYDSTVEDSSQFANFKGLTELYGYATKFPSATGNLELTAYLPAAQSITLSNCGNYEELAGAKSLNNLNTLNISGKTLIRNMSYTENPHIEILKVDVSSVESPEQLQRLADMQKIKSVTIQANGTVFSSSQLGSVKESIMMRHPEATVTISTY